MAKAKKIDVWVTGLYNNPKTGQPYPVGSKIKVDAETAENGASIGTFSLAQPPGPDIPPEVAKLQAELEAATARAEAAEAALADLEGLLVEAGIDKADLAAAKSGKDKQA